MSLPSRERGLKSILANIGEQPVYVAPLTGAWIEIFGFGCDRNHLSVAPLTGAWIEILKWTTLRSMKRSLPSRERKLQSLIGRYYFFDCNCYYYWFIF